MEILYGCLLLTTLSVFAVHLHLIVQLWIPRYAQTENIGYRTDKHDNKATEVWPVLGSKVTQNLIYVIATLGFFFFFLLTNHTQEQKEMCVKIMLVFFNLIWGPLEFKCKHLKCLVIDLKKKNYQFKLA